MNGAARLVTARTTSELLGLVDDATVQTIVLASDDPFVFNESIAVPGTALDTTALLVGRSMEIRSEVGYHAILNASGSADAPRRVLTVLGGVVLNMSGVTFTGGFLTAAGGGGVSVQPGGTLSLADSHIVHNAVVRDSGLAEAGGIINWGTLRTKSCSISYNRIDHSSGTGVARGGGLFNRRDAELIRTTIEHNHVTTMGNGISGGGLTNLLWAFTPSRLTIRLCTIAFNRLTSLSPDAENALGGGVHNGLGGIVEMYSTSVESNLIESESLAFGSGVSNVRNAVLIVLLSNITSNRIVAAGSGYGGGISQGSSSPIFLVETRIDGNHIEGGVSAVGLQIFNGNKITYVLPAPLGRWLAGTVFCPSEPVICPGAGVCPNQPCDAAAHPWTAGRVLANLVIGPTDEDFPPPCETGSYAATNEIAEQQLPTCSGLCAEIDPFSTTAGAGAISAAACNVCQAGFFFATATSGVCEACPIDTTVCSSDGTTLETLELARNHWRLSERTSDVRACDVHPGRRSSDPTTCRGGADPSAYCYEGLTGPLCKVCVEADHYRDVQSARCVPCEVTGLVAFAFPFAFALAAATIVALVYLIWRELKQWPEYAGTRLMVGIDRVVAALKPSTRLVSELGLIAHAKVLVGYFQVISVVPEVYAVALPPEYYEAMRYLDWLSLDVFSIVPFRCLGGFGERLRITALAPLIALLSLVAVVAAASAAAAVVQRGDESKLTAREVAMVGARGGALSVLPFALFALFALVPAVSSRIFSTFSCEEFGYDSSADADPPTRSFLYADYAVECEGEQYDRYRALASGLVVLWPLGVPVLFLGLLLSSRVCNAQWSGVIALATRFLYAEYRPAYFFWELLEVSRRLFLTGFVLLIPQQQTLVRLLVAIAISIGHLLCMLIARPYKRWDDQFFASFTSVVLLVTLLSFLLITMWNALPADLVKGFFGFDASSNLTVVVVAISFSTVFQFLVLLIVLVLVGRRLRRSHRNQSLLRFRSKTSGEMIAAERIAASEYHLLLSHSWEAGQDQMRVVKQRLLELMPDLRIFLDVDDLEDVTELEGYVKRSRAVLVFCSAQYAERKNCVRELACAVARPAPLIALLEPEARRGGVTLAHMWQQLVEAGQARFGEWGIGADAPSGAALADALEADDPIEWNRDGAFQLVTLRLIAQRLLPAGREASTTYVQGEIVHHEPRLYLPDGLYCSPHNAGAAALMSEVVGARRALATLRFVETEGGLSDCRAMLLYLTAQTWTRGLASAQLGEEVGQAIKEGRRLVLAHEVGGVGQEGRKAIEFDVLFQPGQTPRELLGAGIYNVKAVALKGAAWRETSMALLAQAIADEVDDAEASCLSWCSPRLSQAPRGGVGHESASEQRGWVQEGEAESGRVVTQGGHVIERDSDATTLLVQGHGGSERGGVSVEMATLSRK